MLEPLIRIQGKFCMVMGSMAEIVTASARSQRLTKITVNPNKTLANDVTFWTETLGVHGMFLHKIMTTAPQDAAARAAAMPLPVDVAASTMAASSGKRKAGRDTSVIPIMDGTRASVLTRLRSSFRKT